jgi:quercetin dioxygenase-like cupin family protein
LAAKVARIAARASRFEPERLIPPLSRSHHQILGRQSVATLSLITKRIGHEWNRGENRRSACRCFRLFSGLANFLDPGHGIRYPTFMNPTQYWFLNTFVTLRVSRSDGQDGVSVLEHHVPEGDSPPLHIHHTEDEIFHILEGEFRLQLQDQEHRVGPGATLLVPKGVAHTYRAVSPAGGRFLTVTARGDFEGFVRAMGRPALHPGLPELAGPPPPEAIQALANAAAQYGIEIVGPPLQ